MSELLHFSEHTLQEVALLIMVLVYAVRITWLLRFKAGRDRQAPTGQEGRTSPAKGILWSLGIIAMPWAMESQRTRLFFYLQFAIFHIGVSLTLALSFVIPYGPGLLEPAWVQNLLQVIIGLAFVVGVLRVYRRLTNKHIRYISTPDDIFSIIMLTVWFAFAFLSVPNSTANGEWHLLGFFIMTALFILYVPFSKISHYIYYPFTRYYLGKTLGHRGVFPIQRSVKPAPLPQQQQKASKNLAASAQA